FVKKGSWIGRELERIPKYEILVIEEDLILLQVTDRNCRDDGHFVYPSTALAVEQYAGKAEIAYRALDNCVRPFDAALHTEPAASANDLTRHGLGEPRLDAIS